MNTVTRSTDQIQCRMTRQDMGVVTVGLMAVGVVTLWAMTVGDMRVDGVDSLGGDT